ncbi:thioredoxin-like protein [Hymenopellis radicata]|nr:thioredoxin-like protein [Hymenopellis radicata]
MGSIVHIGSLSELDGILGRSKEKVSVIDFHATWCGPCHAIAPTYEALSKKFTSVNFLKCDVDAAQDVAQRYQVTAMPTFIFLRGSTKIDQVRGADKRALESALNKHSSSSTSGAAFTGTGHTLGGGTASNAATNGPIIKLDPQMQIFFGLVGIYLLFWYLS